MVKFFVNLLAAFYGLIGFFSIIPFLLVMFLFGLSFVEPSQIDRQDYVFLLVIFGGSSSIGVLIIYWVHRLNDLGRKAMMAYTAFVLFLLLRIVSRGRIGVRILTLGNYIALGILIFIFVGIVFFLCHNRVRGFFSSQKEIDLSDN